jgi:hypothetical protein
MVVAMRNRPEPDAAAVTSRARPTKVYGESDYDRVTSFLMAIVLGATMIVGWLALIYLTNQAYANRITAPLQIIEVSGGGGGSPDGTPGLTEQIDVAGADASALASNNEEEARDFEEPSVQVTPGAMLDEVAATGEALAEVDIGEAMPSGGLVASGKRASKIGSGGPGLGPGFGPGDGGVAREQRWSIVYPHGDSPDEYARQLDGVGVELAVVAGPNQLVYVSKFSESKPTIRYGSGQGDNRLYFCWQGRGRKGSDVALIQRAGIEVGDKDVFQFYPAGVEQQLSRLETRYRGRQPGEIRTTRFVVKPQGDGYGFEVVAQETLR